MEPEFLLNGKRVLHPLEESLRASGWAILTAMGRQRMAVMNVKGQLAEYYLNEYLDKLVLAGQIATYEWRLESPDFSVSRHGQTYTVECKNMRKENPKKGAQDPWWVETQRTRDSKKGEDTRAYSASDFDILAVCLFNRTQEWKYWFVANHCLGRRPANNDLLLVHQDMPNQPNTVWHENIEEAMDDFDKAKRKARKGKADL